MVSHNKVFLDGWLGTTGAERWSIGLTYAGPTGEAILSPSLLNDWAQEIALYLSSTTIPGLKNLMSSSASIRNIRTYYYPGTGPALAAGAATIASPVTGSGTIAKPPQSAAVFTLLTGFAGRSYRGRVYWPWLSTAIDGTSLKGTVPGTAAAEFAAVLNGIGAEAPGDVDLLAQVYSPTLDLVTPVTQVRIGDVHDTQRRRRDSLVELYQTASL